jgi:hypothetical protein
MNLYSGIEFCPDLEGGSKVLLTIPERNPTVKYKEASLSPIV